MNSSSLLLDLLREHYKTLQGYVSAGMEVQKDDSKIFLNANENPYELPGLEGLNRYPEPQPPALLEAFAQTYGVEEDMLVLTRGADEAIVILTKLFCEPHKDAVLLNPPTFGMYGVDAKTMPAGIIETPLLKQNGTFILDKEAIITAAKNPDNHIKLIYICTPNNPSGTSLDHEVILEIAEELEGHAVIIVDETYEEFSDQGSLCEDLETAPNMIILRTLSKSYAFAGMRMGCFISGDRKFVKLARSKALEAYPIPRLTIEAAFHVLSPEIKVIARENIQKILAERKRMETALSASSQVVHIYPSDANFLLVEMKDAKGFCDFCAKNNIILRDFSSKLETENCVRLTIGLPQENNKVLELLERFKG